MNYLGISNKEWVFIAEEAESILIDKEIGQHIIGIYPSGNRIFGDINAAPEIICVYLDTPHRLLDPFASNVIEGYHVTQNGHKILFCELFSWVKFLGIVTTNSNNDMIRNFVHLIPIMLEAQYEDDQLSIIASSAGDYLEKCGWDIPQIQASKEINEESDIENIIKDACYLRTRYILKTQNIFAPCMNADWDTVEKLTGVKDQRILETDEQLCTYMNSNKDISLVVRKDINYYRENLIDTFYPIITTDAKEEKDKLTHLVKTYLVTLL